MSAHNTRIVNTRNGTGLPQAQLATNSTYTVSGTGGSTGIPTTATAPYANITVIAGNGTGGFLTPFPTGTTRPATSLNYSGASTTALGATIDVNSSGQFSFYVDNSGGPIDVLIDVQGYFDGQHSSSGFTPVTSRVFDSRVYPNVTLAANSVTSVQVGGVGGIPAASWRVVHGVVTRLVL